MAASSGSLDTSGNSHPTFSFSTPFTMPTSFSDLLASGGGGDDNLTTTGGVSRGLSDRIADRTGYGVPKFKSIPPPSLPISPPSVSPSSYFAIPPGLSPAELLDSPVLLSTSNILPSPTTGTFPTQTFNWKRDYGSNNNQSGVKQEEKNYSDFSFQTQTRPHSSSSSIFQSSTTTNPTEQAWNFQDSTKLDDFSSGKSMVKSEFAPAPSFSPEIATLQTNAQSNGGFQSDYNSSNFHQPNQSIREQRKSDDGYNWRKYGQKQVKGSENPRSYYKCTYPNCPTKKKVERSVDGQITEIVYKGSHNHPKPQSTRRSSSSAASQIQSYNAPTNEIPDHQFATNGSTQMDSAATPENSSISMGDDDFDQSSQKSKSGGGDEFDEDEPDAKRWKKESENEIISAPGSRTVREPRVVVQTTSDIDILDDGFCSFKSSMFVPLIQLLCLFLRKLSVHFFQIWKARGSGNHSANRQLPPVAATAANNNAAAAIRPSIINTHNQHNYSNNSTINPLRNLRVPTSETQAPPFTLEMLQSPGSFGFSGDFGNSMSMAAYMNHQLPQNGDGVFSRAKEEPRDEMFIESFLT
nr:WRKY [Loropetalum chinense var. rubrum]